MISPLLVKLYGIILEKKINEWLEMAGKRDKGQTGFIRNHSITDHLITHRIIAEECHNNKSGLFCCFKDFRKGFNAFPRNNPWNRLEDIKVHFELRVFTIRLYEKVISKFKNNEELSMDINYNIGTKQGFPFSLSLFGISLIQNEKLMAEKMTKIQL